MLEWFVGIAAALLVLLIYFTYFFKFNWIRDMTCENGTQKIGGIHARYRNRKVGKLPPVYPNGWFALLESWQLKKGQVKHVSALGENFAVFRTEKGVVNILDAYCPHLGANMAEGGRVKGDCLECPFHNWTFRGEDGRCNDIPYTEKVPHIARAKTWKCCEVNHIIFVWYHAESDEPDWQPQMHPSIFSGACRYQGRNEFLVNCHIQDIAENGADLAHLNVVHRPSMFLWISWLLRHTWVPKITWRPYSTHVDDGTTATDAEVRVKLNGDDSSVASDDHRADRPTAGVVEKERHKAIMHVHHYLTVLERFSTFKADVYVEQIGPGYVVLTLHTSFGIIYMLQTVTPVGPLLQRVNHQIFSPPLLAPLANLIFLAECIMFERDIAIWDHKTYERQPILVREDRAVSSYRRWYSQFYSENSPTYETATKNLEW